MKGYKTHKNESADTYLHSQFWIFPSELIVALVLLMVFPVKRWAQIFFVSTAVILWVLERMGITPAIALLGIRSRIAGKNIKRRRSMFNKVID
jgi:hypothetical protein